jgi:Bacterial regulatory helix-turn-helix protein, lysR family
VRELRQLRYFVTLAEELHFGRAAEREHIVQSALSRQVQRLEREPGTRLLERSTHHVALTASGVTRSPSRCAGRPASPSPLPWIRSAVSSPPMPPKMSSPSSQACTRRGGCPRS